MISVDITSLGGKGRWNISCKSVTSKTLRGRLRSWALASNQWETTEASAFEEGRDQILRKVILKMN